jgi:hypothetical protein
VRHDLIGRFAERNNALISGGAAHHEN